MIKLQTATTDLFSFSII